MPCKYTSCALKDPFHNEMKKSQSCVILCICLSPTGLFETLPGHVQCEMLLKATEQCFNTLEKAEMLLLLLKRFPESVVQHGVRKDSMTLMF